MHPLQGGVRQEEDAPRPVGGEEPGEAPVDDAVHREEGIAEGGAVGQTELRLQGLGARRTNEVWCSHAVPLGGQEGVIIVEDEEAPAASLPLALLSLALLSLPTPPLCFL